MKKRTRLERGEAWQEVATPGFSCPSSRALPAFFRGAGSFFGELGGKPPPPKKKKRSEEGMEAAVSWRGGERGEPQSGSESLRLFRGCTSPVFLFL